VCVAINTSREVFEISAFGGNRLYRIIYATSCTASSTPTSCTASSTLYRIIYATSRTASSTPTGCTASSTPRPVPHHLRHVPYRIIYANVLYRIIYANVLYFIVIHGGPLLLIAFFNVKLIQALKHRQRRRAEMGKSWYQQ